MPHLLGEASTPRAIFFLMGRTAELLTLGLGGVDGAHTTVAAHRLTLGAGLALGWLGGVISAGLVSDHVCGGQGVTEPKRVMSMCCARLGNWPPCCGSVRGRRRSALLLLLGRFGPFVMGTGELAFTSYVSPSDFQNILATCTRWARMRCCIGPRS